MHPLALVGLILALIHFTVPLTYYWHLKRRYLHKPWNLKLDPNYRPKVTVIVPTYNEAELIEKKLDNIAEQEYPRDKLEVIVVDSASNDGTPEKVREWSKKHPELNLKLITEPVRKGKAYALNTALKHSQGEIVVITDADSFWPDRRTLLETVKWLSDPTVGAVSCIKTPANQRGIEDTYRQYYNTLRILESKAWSTPVFHGELAAYKKKLLEEIGGFPTDLGADDSHTATQIALRDYRAITPETLKCVELIPKKSYHSWRIRRAQHLIQHFAKTLRTKHRTPKQFKKILAIETWLHLANPWTLITATATLITTAIAGSMLASLLLAIGALLLIYKPYRTWITTQLHLALATIRNLWTKELAWSKQNK